MHKKIEFRRWGQWRFIWGILLALSIVAPMRVEGQPELEISGQVVFTTDRDANYEIYVMNSDGSNPTNLTNDPGLDYNPRWSPDRSKILFSSDRDGDYEIYVMNADGTNLVKLTDNTAAEKNADWSPDGTQIVFDSNADGGYDIYVMDADGSNVQNKTNNTVGNTNPRWSPDGTKIAFYSGLSSGVGIWTMHPDGSQLEELAISTSNTTLSWSPDGSKIAYVDHDGSDDEIWVMDSDGSNKVQLTSNSIFDGSIAWSADGGRILYTSGAYGSNNIAFEIYQMSPNGSDIAQLTNNLALDSDPDWANIKHIGSAVAGNTASRTMQIKNTGDQTLTVSNISSNDGQFSASPTSFSVAVGDSQGVEIAFAPSAEGVQYATLSIVSNDPDQLQADIIINGVGTPCAEPLSERLYAPLGDRLAVIDGATHAVGEIPLPAGAPYSSIRGLSQSWDGSTLLIVTNEAASGVLLFEPSSESFGAFYPLVGNPRLTAADFDDDMSHIFVVGQDGTLFVIDRSDSSVVTHGIPSQNFDGETAPDGSKFYAGSRDGGTLSIFDGTTHAPDTPWGGLPAGPHQIVLNADGTRGYVTHEYAGSMSCLNMTDRTLIGTIGVGSHPIPVAISDDGQTVYVGNRDSNSISVIDANSCAVTGTIASALTGSNVHSLGYASGKIYAGGGATNINVYDATTLASVGVIPLTSTVGGQHIFTVSSMAPVAVSLPDTSSLYAQSLTVPVWVENTSCKGVVSAEIFVAFDGALLTVNDVTVVGGLAAGWTLEHNVVSGAGLDTLKIAMATDADTLAGSGALAYIDFAVADLRAPAYSPLYLAHALFNDGSPGSVKTDGSLTLVGTDGTLEHPVQVLVYPSDAIALVVTDPDENRSVAQRETLSVSVHNIYNGDIETMAMAEDGVSNSVFAGSIATVFSLSASSGDGQIQGKAGDPVVSIYIDSLDVNGNTIFRADTTIFQGGFDGRLSTTVVVQPGDTVRVKVVDEDLSQWAFVSIENQRSGEVGSALLQAFSSGSSVFYGRFFTNSAPSIAGDSTLSILDCDTLLITYNDQLTALGGASVLVEKTNAVAPFGDANDDGNSGAFDAALTLLHVLSPFLQTWDTLSVNVDSLAPFSAITPFDASLILQKRVGLIDRFPVQIPVSINQPQPETSLQPGPKKILDARWLSLRPAEGYLGVWADELNGIVAGELLVSGVEGEVQVGEQWKHFLVKSRATEEGLHIAFAGAEAVSGPGELLRVYGVGPEGAQLIRGEFNDGRIAVEVEVMPMQAVPAVYALHANAPNPFNPTTSIRFDLPQAGQVRLEIFDVLGQQIRVLVAQALPAGGHQFIWDGRDHSGRQVGSGMYLYRLEVGAFTQVRRMLLLK